MQDDRLFTALETIPGQLAMATDPPTPERTECVRDREGLWHVATGVHTDTFQPILCGGPEIGIVMPGWNHDRPPTCPECIGALRHA